MTLKDVAKLHKIPHSVLCKAFKRQAVIREQAGQIDAVKLLGMRVRGKTVVYKRRMTTAREDHLLFFKCEFMI